MMSVVPVDDLDSAIASWASFRTSDSGLDLCNLSSSSPCPGTMREQASEKWFFLQNITATGFAAFSGLVQASLDL